MALATAILLATVGATPAAAGYYVYRYDSLGRVYRVCNALLLDGELTTYGLDNADNRTSYTNTKTDFAIFLNSGVSSQDGRFTLKLQNSGLLQLIQNSSGQALWTSSNTSPATSAYMQSDGNFVLYNASTGVWSSNTYSYFCSRLTVQNDGNVVLQDMDDVVRWQTNTGGH